MRIFIRLIPVVVAMFGLLGHEDSLFADPSGCPGCASNSPIINPFPIMWLRSGTSEVLKGNSKCQIVKGKRASLAISMIDYDFVDKHSKSHKHNKIRGYQLIVVSDAYLDGSTNVPICSGSDLTGITFILSEGFEPVTIQQIATAAVTPDPHQLSKHECHPDFNDFRLVYYISGYRNLTTIAGNQKPTKLDSSLCNNLLQRRKDHNGDIHALLPEPLSDLKDLSTVLPDQESEYAVIIPEAEYDINGDLPSGGHPTSKKKLRPLHIQPANSTYGDVSLEWFELACASGALAHTDLNGLVDVGEPPDIRTAAVRMVSAKYHSGQSHTLYGIPVFFSRDILPAPECKVDTSADIKLPSDSVIEARWNKGGATCMTHSRLWMKDFIISETRNYSNLNRCLAGKQSACLEDSEEEFRTKFDLPKCTDLAQDNDSPPGIFTTYAVHHIDHSSSSQRNNESDHEPAQSPRN